MTIAVKWDVKHQTKPKTLFIHMSLHVTTNFLTVRSGGSEQFGYLPSLIRVIAGSMGKL